MVVSQPIPAPRSPPLQVTTTAAKAGGFEARFFHRIYQEEFGNVRGHFGPINSVAFAPDGRSFVTGAAGRRNATPQGACRRGV
jgi:hypothetical protein